MEIKTPDLGVDSAEVSEILVAEGDVIAKDDNIVTLESDKASVEVPSSAAGTVTNIMISVGDTVSEGVVLIEIDADATDDDADSSDADSENNKSSSSTGDINSPSDEKSTSNGNGDSDTDSASNDSTQSDTIDDADDTDSDSENSTSQTYALPDLGVEEAEVAEVMVSEGDTIEAEQSLLLIESDKASVEVPAPVAGTIEKILVAAGDTVVNGQDYIVIVSSNSTGSSNSKSDNVSNGTDSKTNSSEINSSKADGESSDTDSNEQQQGKQQQDKQRNSTTGGNNDTSNNKQSKLTEREVNEKLTQVYAGPAVRKLSRQLGVDITQVEGSALNNRILKEDVFDYVKSHMAQADSTASKTAASNTGATRAALPALPDMSKVEIWGETDTQDLTRLQKVSIPQLNYNTYLPQVTQFDLSDITDTENLRGELKGDFKAQGIGLTILAFIVKATAYALQQHPKFNSHLSDDNTQVIIRKTVNMGIAVATDDGLIVPVIKDAQTKGIKQIAIEIGDLAEKARDKKLTTKDLQGASFTISSQGNLGGTYFTPLVNWPQVAILGVSEASMQPRWNKDKQSFEPRLMLPLSLSYDHRVINGADAAVFTRYVAKVLADPRRILL